jgi:hypothetical protein
MSFIIGLLLIISHVRLKSSKFNFVWFTFLTMGCSHTLAEFCRFYDCRTLITSHIAFLFVKVFIKSTFLFLFRRTLYSESFRSNNSYLLCGLRFGEMSLRIVFYQGRTFLIAKGFIYL